MQGILSGLVGSLMGGLGGGNGQQQAFRSVHHDMLRHSDWWDSALETAANYISCTAGVYTTVGRYQCPPQQIIAFGFGSAQFPDNQGYAYLAFYDDTATNSVLEPGQVRLVERDYNSYTPIVVAADPTRIFGADLTDRKKMRALPEQVQVPRVGEDSYLEIQLAADATDNVVKTAIGTAAGADVWDIPITRRIL
jgi:hypothetical protein